MGASVLFPWFCLFAYLHLILITYIVKKCNLRGIVFMQETSGAYARMSFDLEEVRSRLLISCIDS